jgi:hypothetical protein
MAIQKSATNQVASKSSVRSLAKPVVRHVGIMVGPGRYVNLANPTMLTYEQRVRGQIDRAMRAAKFTHHALRCEDRIYEAIQMARKYLVKPHHSYLGKKVTRQSFGTTRPNNRTQEAMRMLFIASLWAAWAWGKQALPKVNNRRNPDTDFVAFVKFLSPLICMGNVVKNLERYQSYRRATMRGLSYSAWQASHPI